MIARVPWLAIAKVAVPAAIVLGLSFALWWATGVIDRTRLERDAAVGDVLAFRRIVTDATVTAASDGERPLLSTGDAKTALAGALRDRDDARASLRRIDRDTKAAKVRGEAADTALVRTQAANLIRLGAAQARIDALESARPSPVAAENDAAIEDDSKAAWESWR